MIFYYLSNFYRYRKYILIFESSYYRLLLFHIIERKKKREREYTITRRERKIFLLHWKKKKKKRKSFSSIKVFPLLPFSSSSSFFFLHFTLLPRPVRHLHAYPRPVRLKTRVDRLETFKRLWQALEKGTNFLPLLPINNKNKKTT